MKRLFSAGIVAVFLAGASGCIVRDRHRHNRPVKQKSTSCGKHHHWNGYKCVHDRDHRR
jgi:hypothetical protein